MHKTRTFPRAVAVGLLLVHGAQADPRDTTQDPDMRSLLESADRRSDSSPVRRIERSPSPPPEPPTEPDTRTIDGSGNNLAHPRMNAAGSALARLVPAEYADGRAALAGADRPGPRTVSNIVCAQAVSVPNAHGASDYLWQWGQFLDHDIDLTDGVDPAEPADIPIPAGDPWFDPEGSGSRVLPFNRSLWHVPPGSPADGPRQQVNEITGWIDASNVYGSDVERATALRALDGTGRLLTSPSEHGELLPWNEAGLANAGGSSATLFVAGDVRANEQIGLTAMHTLFVREHNRLVARFALEDPSLDGETLYQRARAMVAAQMQVITYREFLPALLGPRALRRYRGYRPDVDAQVANEFSTAAYRFGHSTLNQTLLRLGADGEVSTYGHLALRDAFFSPWRLVEEGGIEPLLRGLAHQAAQRVDPLVIDDVRNFLFGDPGSNGFDLASLNIQRGRDHGLPAYNDVREALGFPRAQGFADVTGDLETRARLAEAYDDVDQVDLWVGGLSEEPAGEGHLGPLFRRILVRQFEALRDGDRFWYRLVLTPDLVGEVERTRLADVIRRNTSIGREIPDDVFQVPLPGRRRGERG